VPIAGLIGATLFEATDERRSFISRFIPTAHTDAAVKSDSKVSEFVSGGFTYFDGGTCCSNFHHRPTRTSERSH
jgi:hypothetical protein